MKSKQEIISEVQELVNEIDIDFYDCVYSCRGLTEEEKEWACDNLGISLIVEHISYEEPE
jgi:hypothetical protein